MPISYDKRPAPHKTEQRHLARTEDEAGGLPHPRSVSQHNIVHLQHTIGNQGVQSLLARQSKRAVPAAVGHMQHSPSISGAVQ